MEIVDGGDWISLAGVIIAGASAVWSAMAARRSRTAQAQAEEQARAAIAAAERAADAQTRAADAAERSCTAETASAAAAGRAADALEQQLAATVERQEEAEGAPWRLQYQFGDTYQLVNESPTPKFHVSLAGESIFREVAAARIDGRSSLQFMAMSAGGIGDELEVRWHRLEDRSDMAQSWIGVKPARSPRGSARTT